ncbi:MAG: ABC transporter permease [Clostridia bacterium]|nr:ABC transporter permease [Clostridia bacterium]
MNMNIKRSVNCINADVKFQLKHGFYTVYIVLSVVYIIINSFISQEALKYVLPILIYMDPAGLGLFFIGGMVLMEKEQGILSLVYITPLRVNEYIVSKIITLGLISALAGTAVSLASYRLHCNYFLLFSGTFLVSVFYTLLGFLIVARVKTVNEYLIKMIPLMLIFIIPCLTMIPNSFLPGFVNTISYAVPSAGGLKLIFAAYEAVPPLDAAVSFLGLILFDGLLIKRVHKILTDKIILNA